MAERQGRDAGDEARHRAERHLGAVGRIDVDALQRRRILLQLGLDLEHDPVLGARRIDRLDLALPDGHGLELVDWLRTQKELRHLPLVVYSAREVTGTEQEQLQLGHTEFLTKAKVQPAEVEALVHTMLRRYGPAASHAGPSTKQLS